MNYLFLQNQYILRNHNLETGDELTYSTNGGNGLSVIGGTSALLQDGETVICCKNNR